MVRYAIIGTYTDPQTGVSTPNTVVNIVEWDGDTGKWQPPAATQAVQSDTAGMLDAYDQASGTFTRPA